MNKIKMFAVCVDTSQGSFIVSDLFNSHAEANTQQQKEAYLPGYDSMFVEEIEYTEDEIKSFRLGRAEWLRTNKKEKISL